MKFPIEISSRGPCYGPLFTRRCLVVKDQISGRCRRSETLKPKVPDFRRVHKLGGGKRVRTADPLLAKQVLFQLSYTPIPTMVGLGRVELPTSPLSGVRSSQLSYRPTLLGHKPGAKTNQEATIAKRRGVKARRT